MAILSGKKEMEIIKILKNGLIIVLLMVLNSCSLYKEMPKLETKYDLINAIMKNPEYAEYYIKNSKFYSTEYTQCLKFANSWFHYFYITTLDTIKKYSHVNYYIGIDTVLETNDLEQNDKEFNRIHLFYDNSYIGIRFDFIKVGNYEYLYEIFNILNKKKIIQESSKKIELLKKIIENPDKYEEIIKNSSFYNNDSTTLGYNEFRDIIIDQYKKLKMENNYSIKHVISYSINEFVPEYYTHLILVISKSDRNIYNFLMFRNLNNEWKITTEGTNAEIIFSELGDENDNY